MIWNDMFMAFTPKQTIWRGSKDGALPGSSGRNQPYPAGHPAGGLNHSRQVSWLTGHRTCSAFPGKPSGMMEQVLTVHSCGGSLGFTNIMSATEFPS